jgi:hypothetical protein
VIFASVVAILVKGYLIWTLGDDVYGAAVSQLLSGNQFERAAGLVLAPDAVSLWIVDAYQQIYRFIVSVATALETGTFPELRVIWAPLRRSDSVFHEERALRILRSALFHSGPGPLRPIRVRAASRDFVDVAAVQAQIVKFTIESCDSALRVTRASFQEAIRPTMSARTLLVARNPAPRGRLVMMAICAILPVVGFWVRATSCCS